MPSAGSSFSLPGGKRSSLPGPPLPRRRACGWRVSPLRAFPRCMTPLHRCTRRYRLGHQDAAKLDKAQVDVPSATEAQVTARKHSPADLQQALAYLTRLPRLSEVQDIESDEDVHMDVRESWLQTPLRWWLPPRSGP